MKSCPACNRTYADDTFTFCLDDGALLSAPFDPQSTLQIPAARNTDQPKTEFLRTPSNPGAANQTQPQAQARPSDPFHYPQGAEAFPSPRKTSGNMRMVVGGVIVLLTAGVLLLGYIVWRGNQNTASDSSNKDANVQAKNVGGTQTTPTNNSVNVNAGGVPAKTPSSPDSRWLEGVWEGKGYQKTPRMTWSLRLTAENNNYVIEYPSLRCAGKWNLVDMGDGKAKFKEVITRGLERCSSDGDILIEKISDSQVSYKYTLPIIGEVATATLNKEATR